MTTSKIPNKLIHEKSPYLLQHAYNPVNWYPWSEEAFTKAKAENKPIFLSIGYSTCHWCHVMAHESFENEEVAAVLNQYFVSIKVDREERPDIDSIYMTACQLMTGHGGWPLTILMNHDQRPFYTTTYLPPRNRFGKLGLVELLDQIRTIWYTLPQEIEQASNDITQGIKDSISKKSFSSMSPELCVQMALSTLKGSFDHDYGGFGTEPKFPTPHNLLFLLHYAYHEVDDGTLFMVEKTLEQMYRGGIYDHIGYGFSRYSTDHKWLVPHFEKMLYDNALLAIVYLETYQYTKKPLYRQVGEEILTYIQREMTDKEGGFYCAQDADSEGVEGKYYVFSPEEIRTILGEDDATFFNQYYDITNQGNFEGKSIPNRILANELKDTQRIKDLNQKVYAYRKERTALHLDDKILTSWNGLMITAYATAAKILQEVSYVNAAKDAISFINRYLSDDDGQLFIRYREGDRSYSGLLDDYAFYILGLISTYEVTFDLLYLEQSMSLINQMITLFWDYEEDGFFLNSSRSEKLLYRPKEVFDGAIPSGNSVACYVLNRFAHITANSYYREFADKQINFLTNQIKDYPAGHCFSLLSFLDALYPSKEIIGVLDSKGDMKPLQNYLAENFDPNRIVILTKEADIDQLSNIAEYLVDYSLLNNKSTYYICENHHCIAPTNQLPTNQLHHLSVKDKSLTEGTF